MTIESYSGAASLQILFHDTVLRNVFQDFSVTEGLIYDASGWVKTNGISGTGALIKILWQDSTGTTLRTDIIDTLTGTQGWTYMTGSNSAPVGAVIARLDVSSAAEPDGIGTAWFDDLSFMLNNQQNLPPVLGPIADITVSEGATVSFSPTATDVGWNSLTYSYSG
ncbi:MAG: hypothetical protein GY727_11770, partial [Gammaproteobacteria bacterium]|nr:hypothetical protein [Gammaproteobacteria bacterium]